MFGNFEPGFVMSSVLETVLFVTSRHPDVTAALSRRFPYCLQYLKELAPQVREHSNNLNAQKHFFA